MGSYRQLYTGISLEDSLGAFLYFSRLAFFQAVKGTLSVNGVCFPLFFFFPRRMPEAFIHSAASILCRRCHFDRTEDLVATGNVESDGHALYVAAHCLWVQRRRRTNKRKDVKKKKAPIVRRPLRLSQKKSTRGNTFFFLFSSVEATCR